MKCLHCFCCIGVIRIVLRGLKWFLMLWLHIHMSTVILVCLPKLSNFVIFVITYMNMIGQILDEIGQVLKENLTFCKPSIKFVTC